MRIRSVITVALTVMSLFFISCGEEVLRLDVSKARTATVIREMNIKVAVTVNVPVSEEEMKAAKIETVNKIEVTAETLLEPKDPKKPGLFESSEKIIAANYHISQKQDGNDEKSITMSYEDGKTSVLDKKDDAEGSFELSARQALDAMINESAIKALMEIDSQGEIRSIVADASVKKGIELNLEKTAGFFGVIFPEKGIKVGDSWTFKKIITNVEGIDISENPVELVITTVRQKDEKLNGKEFSLFQSNYSMDKKNVSGIFGGFPVSVDIKDAGVTVNYFDKKRKIFVHTIVDSNTKVTTSKDTEQEKIEGSQVVIDIENKSRSVTIEKVD